MSARLLRRLPFPFLTAVGLALAACGTAATPQALPLDLSARGANAEDSATGAEALAPDAMWVPTTYEAGPGLPTLGGDRPVHRLAPGSDDDLMRVAQALGISGEIVRDGTSRRILAGEGALESWDGAWFSYFSGRAIGTDTVVACSPDGECEEQPTPERPADLPTANEARAQAAAVFAAAGLSLDDAEITVDDGITAWFVTVQYRVAGLLVEGLAGYASVDGDGISDVSGPLGTLEEVGDYPTITAVDAIDRLNQGWGPQPMMEGGPAVDLGAVDRDDAVADDPVQVKTEPAPPDEPDVATPDGPDVATPDVPASEEPYVEPEPVVVTVTDVEWGLTTFWSWDGSGVYLLPAYRFTVEGQEYQPVVPAVTDDVIAPPPEETARPDDGVTDETSPGQVVPPDVGSGGASSGSSGTSGSSGSAPSTTLPDADGE